MEKTVNWLSIFLIAALASAFMYYQFRLDGFGALFNDRGSVPLLVLTFGPFIQIAVLCFVLRFFDETPAARQLFPRLPFFEDGNGRNELLWERLSAAAIIGLPLLGFGWSWVRFLHPRHLVWEAGSNIEVSRFHLVSPTLFYQRWNDHRFGETLGVGGASFVPFWQPVLLMGLPSLVVLVLTVRILAILRHRLPVRRRTVHRQ